MHHLLTNSNSKQRCTYAWQFEALEQLTIWFWNAGLLYIYYKHELINNQSSINIFYNLLLKLQSSVRAIQKRLILIFVIKWTKNDTFLDKDSLLDVSSCRLKANNFKWWLRKNADLQLSESIFVFQSKNYTRSMYLIYIICKPVKVDHYTQFDV